jgi:hypothetical protein
MAVQFCQECEGKVEVRFQPGSQWARDREEPMRAGLLKKLGDDFELTLREVSEVEKTSAGKQKWLVTSLRQAQVAM